MNGEGLTWKEWSRAAGDAAIRAHNVSLLKQAWVRGEDPTEWRAVTEAAEHLATIPEKREE